MTVGFRGWTDNLREGKARVRAEGVMKKAGKRMLKCELYSCLVL